MNPTLFKQRVQHTVQCACRLPHTPCGQRLYGLHNTIPVHRLGKRKQNIIHDFVQRLIRHMLTSFPTIGFRYIGLRYICQSFFQENKKLRRVILRSGRIHLWYKNSASKTLLVFCGHSLCCRKTCSLYTHPHSGTIQYIYFCKIFCNSDVVSSRHVPAAKDVSNASAPICVRCRAVTRFPTAENIRFI